MMLILSNALITALINALIITRDGYNRIGGVTLGGGITGWCFRTNDGVVIVDISNLIGGDLYVDASTRIGGGGTNWGPPYV